MIIRKSMAGAIIGPGGQSISRIVAESQAFIAIGGINDNDEWLISITGTPEEVKKARRLLEQAIRENFAQVGHLARECHEEEDTCYKCNGSGHIARNCSQKKNTS